MIWGAFEIYVTFSIMLEEKMLFIEKLFFKTFKNVIYVLLSSPNKFLDVLIIPLKNSTKAFKIF
jgi:hypothetical protein